MHKTKFNYILILFFLFTVDFAYSQNKIIGKILDADNLTPIEFCLIKSLNPNDSLPKGGSTTDDKGDFVLNTSLNDKVLIKVEFIGYQKTIFGPFTIIKGQVLDLGTLKLPALVVKTQEVVVKGEKEDIQFSLEKKVFNTDKNITSAGGTAIDVLKNVPSVSVDNDGNVSLRGNNQVIIYINGKPTSASDNNAEAILGQLPSSSIESIEVITNPGARFDAQGMAGIINIKLKEDLKKKPISGQINAGIGTREKYNTSVSLNFNMKKLSITSNYTFRHNPLFSQGSNDRNTYLPDTLYKYYQSTYGIASQNAQSGRLGLEYNFNKFNTTQFSSLYSYGTNPFPESSNYNFFFPNNTPMFSINRKNNSDTKSTNVEFSLNHKKIFDKPGKELNFGSSYSYTQGLSAGNYTQDKFDAMGNKENYLFNQVLNSDNKTHLTTFQIDYILPLENERKIEFGTKATSRVIQNDFNLGLAPEVLGVSKITDKFNYHDEVFAMYSQYSNTKKDNKFKYSFGLRAEQTLSNAKIESNKNYNYTNNYLSLFPSAVLSYGLAKGQDLQINASRRINRPRSAQLNPFLDWNDFPFNIRKGNPELQPEFVYTAEVSHILNKEKITFTSSVYFRQINNAVQYYRIIDTLGNSNLTFRNFKYGQNVGFEFIMKNNFTKWLDATTTVNILRQKVLGEDVTGATIERITPTWNVKSIVNIKLPFGVFYQISGNYNAAGVAAQGSFLPIYGIDMALKRDFLKDKKLSLTVNVSDIFDTRRMRIQTESTYFTQDIMRKRESQIGMFIITYKFGANDNKPKKVEKSEQNSGGDMF